MSIAQLAIRLVALTLSLAYSAFCVVAGLTPDYEFFVLMGLARAS